MPREDLSNRIAEEFKRKKHLILREDSEVKPGQIRQIRDKDLRSESRLALVVGVNKLGRNCEVILVNELSELATPRDIEATINDSQFSFTIFPDFQGNVDLDQVDLPNLIGSICEECSKEINKVRDNQTSSLQITLPSHGCFNWGTTVLVPLSRMAEFREEEYFEFDKLLNKFDDYNLFMESREFQYFYSKQHSMNQFIGDISKEIPGAIERKEFLMQLRKNPRQLAVLRGR